MESSSSKRAAFLWDESFLWGLLSYKALKKLSLDFALISRDEIRDGGLSGFSALYVPGGWASNKLKALGEAGAGAIRDFVSSGGVYIGICGGAGLATSAGLGLLPIERRPLKERAPSIGGLVRVEVNPHPIWKGTKPERALFHIWWPSQFAVKDSGPEVLARFLEGTEKTGTSDFNFKDVQELLGWQSLESDYGINLDPARMKGAPLVIEGRYGKGRVLASLIHFDTPGDKTGAACLENIRDYFGLERKEWRENKRAVTGAGKKLISPVREIMEFGERNFLWHPNGALTRWRRGVRGLEYLGLYEVVKELAGFAVKGPEYAALAEELSVFSKKSKELLMLERMALQRGERLTFSNALSPRIQELRLELFGRAKSHGGEFKRLLDTADGLLLKRLRECG